MPVSSRFLACMASLALLSCGGGGPNSLVSPGSVTPPPQSALLEISTDTFTNSGSQHETEVETHAAAFGQTIVSAFQVGRIFQGGSADIGFATSLDDGATWTRGVLPSLTLFAGNGHFLAASDPVVAYDAAHATWTISSLAIEAGTDVVVVSRSRDALTWDAPIAVSATPDADKNWIACDNTPSSPFFGHCYSEWDDPSTANGLVWMSTSTDGGLTWSGAQNTANMAAGIGGQILIQPNGKVTVALDNDAVTAMLAFSSRDGGAIWSATSSISTIVDHQVAGNFRTLPLPAAQVDSAGKMYVVWQDCRFRQGCLSNDIVMSTSADGTNWSEPVRLPIGPASDALDRFSPTLAVDAGAPGKPALMYQYYPQAACVPSTCQLKVGFMTSQNAGATWSAPVDLGGAETLAWLPNTLSGFMNGDYSGMVVANGRAWPVLSLASQNAGSAFHQSVRTVSGGIAFSASASSARAESPAVRSTRPDHATRRFTDLDHKFHREPGREKL